MKITGKLITATWISLAGLYLTGCSSLLTSKMPEGGMSMQQAYTNALNDENDTHHQNNSGSLDSIRKKVDTLRIQPSNYIPYTRTQENEINSQFPMLPNKNIVMYIFPHEAGTGYNMTPVPGYSTVFPLYTHVYYAMPGEVDG